jgi:hypothetical protein
MQRAGLAPHDVARARRNLRVPAAASVTWANGDDAPHSARAKGGSWDTGILNKGDEKTLTFDRAGDYLYYCTVHTRTWSRALRSSSREAYSESSPCSRRTGIDRALKGRNIGSYTAAYSPPMAQLSFL